MVLSRSKSPPPLFETCARHARCPCCLPCTCSWPTTASASCRTRCSARASTTAWWRSWPRPTRWVLRDARGRLPGVCAVCAWGLHIMRLAVSYIAPAVLHVGHTWRAARALHHGVSHLPAHNSHVWPRLDHCRAAGARPGAQLRPGRPGRGAGAPPARGGPARRRPAAPQDQVRCARGMHPCAGTHSPCRCVQAVHVRPACPPAPLPACPPACPGLLACSREFVRLSPGRCM